MDKFTKDFDFFWGLIENKKNFTFARYADGEVLLMKGMEVSNGTQALNIDKWSSPNRFTKVGAELIDSMNHTEDNYYYAISGINDNINDYSFLINNLNQNKDRVTFVNLWINNNYKRMIEKLKSLEREVILICNENAKISNFPFKIKELIPFPNDCVNFWEKESESFMRNLFDKVSILENELFFISCGPISEIIIHKLFLENPNNTYIDVGSSIDEFVHGYKTRPYMNENTQYNRHISTF
jgi:hypothetical protein